MIRLADKLGAQHGPTCFSGFIRHGVCLHGVMGIEHGLQMENLGAPPSPVDPTVNAESDPDMVRAPKQPHCIAMHDHSLPTAVVTLCSQHQGYSS
jgi:hypothetical protein